MKINFMINLPQIKKDATLRALKLIFNFEVKNGSDYTYVYPNNIPSSWTNVLLGSEKGGCEIE